MADQAARDQKVFPVPRVFQDLLAKRGQKVRSSYLVSSKALAILVEMEGCPLSKIKK